MKRPIYLDNHATTAIDPRVTQAMKPFCDTHFGNPASQQHVFGQAAREAVEAARAQVAQLIGAKKSEEIIFTSGTTEANNMAVKGVAEMYQSRGCHIITSVIEHKSILETCRYLETKGCKVTYLPVDLEGFINMGDLERAITPETILISIQMANNEIGVIQRIHEIGRIAKERNIFFHSDIAQAVGKIPVQVESAGIHLASFSAHKMYGPKGIGALYVRSEAPRVRLEPLIHGGGQEHELRSGTLNVMGIVGFGEAAKLAREDLVSDAKQALMLREKLRLRLSGALEETRINGSLAARLPGNLNVSFAYVEGESLLVELNKDIAVSSGSACAGGEPSYVLAAIGVEESSVHASVRFGIGRFNTEEEIVYAADRVIEEVKNLRALSPLYENHRADLDAK